MALRIPKKLADLRDVSALLPIDGQILARAAGVWTPTDAGYLPLTADGITPASGTFTVGGALKAASLQMSSAAALPLKGGMADGASAVSVVSDTPVTYATVGAKIHSFRNNTVVKAYVDKDGTFYPGLGASTIAISLPQTIRLDLRNEAPGTVYILGQGNGSLTLSAGETNLTGYLTRFGNAALTVRGNQSDSASSVSLIVDSPSFTTAGAKSLSVRNNTVEKLYVDKDGYVVSAGAPAGRRVAAPASAGAAGLPGDFAADASWAYFCTATNTWVRAAAATW
jgi:hypothetical protein